MAQLQEKAQFYQAEQQAEQEKALRFAQSRWYAKTWHYMSDTSWGAALFLFVVTLLIFCITRPRFVCRRAPSIYQRDPLDFMKAVAFSLIAAGILLLLCYAFNTL